MVVVVGIARGALRSTIIIKGADNKAAFWYRSTASSVVSSPDDPLLEARHTVVGVSIIFAAKARTFVAGLAF